MVDISNWPLQWSQGWETRHADFFMQISSCRLVCTHTMCIYFQTQTNWKWLSYVQLRSGELWQGSQVQLEEGVLMRDFKMW